MRLPTQALIQWSTYLTPLQKWANPLEHYTQPALSPGSKQTSERRLAQFKYTVGTPGQTTTTWWAVKKQTLRNLGSSSGGIIIKIHHNEESWVTTNEHQCKICHLSGSCMILQSRYWKILTVCHREGGLKYSRLTLGICVSEFPLKPWQSCIHV